MERVERNGPTAAITLIFPHFPTNSRWYRLRWPCNHFVLSSPGKSAESSNLLDVGPYVPERWVKRKGAPNIPDVEKTRHPGWWLETVWCANAPLVGITVASVPRTRSRLGGFKGKVGPKKRVENWEFSRTSPQKCGICLLNLSDFFESMMNCTIGTFAKRIKQALFRLQVPWQLLRRRYGANSLPSSQSCLLVTSTLIQIQGDNFKEVPDMIWGAADS